VRSAEGSAKRYELYSRLKDKRRDKTGQELGKKQADAAVWVLWNTARFFQKKGVTLV